MTTRTGLSNAGAAARRLYGKRYGGISVRNSSTRERDEFEGKVTGSDDETLLYVVGSSADETTAMMCGALRAAKLPKKKHRPVRLSEKEQKVMKKLRTIARGRVDASSLTVEDWDVVFSVMSRIPKSVIDRVMLRSKH